MKLLDGLSLSKQIKIEVEQEVKQLTESGLRTPHLAAILVGSNGASMTYVGSKIKDCKEVGIKSTLLELPEEITEKELINQIERLNELENLDGFIVQLPLPNHIDEEKVLLAVNPEKDVDGFHPENFGRMALEMESFIPATPYGILTLLQRNRIDTEGKHAVIIGRSHIVGKPMSVLLAQKGNPGNCTVTLTHSRTKNLEEITKQADIIVTALGVPNFLKAEMVKEGAIVIDVGITRVEDASSKRGYVIKGDVDFENVAPKTSYITPVPGGVGPMTRAMLLRNTLLAYTRNQLKD